VVDYWFRYHIAKGVLAAALLVVLIALGVLIWQAFIRARGLLRAVALAAGGVSATALAVISLTAVLANVHGTAAPFGSLLPMLFGGSGEPTGTLTQIRRQLDDGQHPPALKAITSDYVRFHAVMAVEGTVVVVGSSRCPCCCGDNSRGPTGPGGGPATCSPRTASSPRCWP
jgi:hypothetical protein